MLKRLLLGAVCSAFVPIASYAGIYGILTGKVTNKKGEPLSGASIRVLGTPNGARSKGDGSYTIQRLNPGTLEVSVKLLSYKELRVKTQLSADQTRELNFTLVDSVSTTGPIIVTTDREKMIDNSKTGTIQKIDNRSLTETPRETIGGVVAMQAGVQTIGNGFALRGSRTTETQVRVNGVDVGDQFTGGLGSLSADRFPTVSSFATEEVQVVSGGANAEYGNALGGTVNMVTKSGKTDKYEAFLRYRRDVPFLYGSANNGLKLEAPNDQTVELGFGGPLPGIDGATFFVSGKNNTIEFGSAGIGVIDPLGNNLGKFANSGVWIRNINGKVKIPLASGLRLELSGTNGVTSLETASWGWLYANDPMVKPSSTVLGGYDTTNIPERLTKQNVLNQYARQAYARLGFDLSEQSTAEVTFMWSQNRTENGRRTNYNSPSLLGGIDVYVPEDRVTPIYSNVNEALIGYEYSKDFIPDIYYPSQGRTLTTDGYLSENRPVRNPFTGYIEGDGNATGTKNPYGLQQFFFTHGNSSGFEFRESQFLQLDGNYEVLLETKQFKHKVRAGFEARRFTLHRLSNQNPWDGNPFLDVYTDKWGGNAYTGSEEVRQLTSKPYNPITGSLWVSDQITFKGLIITPGLRLDYLDANTLYRNSFASGFLGIQEQLNPANSSNFSQVGAKIRVAPRLSITYPVGERANFSLSYGVYYQDPQKNNMYDGFNAYILRGNAILGDPNLSPQSSKQYQISYESQLTDDFSLSVTAYYKDIYGQVGLKYVPASPVPFSQYTVGEYGNNRGLEIGLTKRPFDHFSFNINYTLALARGTASNAESNYSAVILAGSDPFTGQQRTFPLTDYYLDIDRRHRVNVMTSIFWNNNEGPAIGGIYPLENLTINFTAFYQTGLPYTKLDFKGVQVGEFNGERFPDNWRVDTRIQKSFAFPELLGSSFKDLRVSLFVDITNLINRVEPVSVYARTGNPDYNGVSLNRRIGDFIADNWYKSANPNFAETFSVRQYDSFGNRLYNEVADSNKDGVVTVYEKFESYQRFVADNVARRALYQLPRQVFAGIMIQF